MEAMIMRSRTRTAILFAVLALVAAGCATKADLFEIGIRRAALDLAFNDAEISARQVVAGLVPAEEFLDQIPDERLKRAIRIPAVQTFECATADPNQTPVVPAFAVVKDPPKPGVYERHNAGTLRVTIGTSQPLSIPYPRATEWHIRDVRPVKVLNYANDDAEEVPGAVPRGTGFVDRMEFSLTRIAQRGFSVTDTFRYSRGDAGATGEFLWLTKRVTVVNGQVSEFNPTPPIRYVELFVPEGTDSEVNHGGMDRATNVALAVQSKILGREWVDVCGENIDTYRVEISESMVDLSKNPPEVSGNVANPSFWNIQFDNGLLIAREEVHTTQRTSFAGPAGARIPITVEYDYISILNYLEPTPLPPGAAGGR